MRGNVIDLAIAIIIGGAFNTVVQSLVTDIVTPAILTPTLRAANLTNISELGYNGIMYGDFVAAVLNFFLVSFVLFAMVKVFESSRRQYLRLILDKQNDESNGDLAPEDAVVRSQQELVGAIQILTETIRNISQKETTWPVQKELDNV